MIHIIKDVDNYAEMKEGDNFQVIRTQKLPKQGDTLLFMHKDEQKTGTVQDVATPKGLMKGYYHVHHVVKTDE